MGLIKNQDGYFEARGLDLYRSIQAAIRDRKGWENEIKQIRRIYDQSGMRYNIHWEGASDLHFPVLYEKVEAIVPRLRNALWMPNPKVVVQRRVDEYDPEETRIQQAYINTYIENDIPNLHSTLLMWIRNSLLDGVSQVKTYWSKKWKNTVEHHGVKVIVKAGEEINGTVNNLDREKTVNEILDEIFTDGYFNLKKVAKNTYTCDIVERRRAIDGIRIEFMESEFVDEILVRVFRPVLAANNVEVEVVEADELIVPYRSCDLQRADWVAQQHQMKFSDIARLASEDTPEADRWELTEEDMRDLESLARTGKRWAETHENDGMRDERDGAIGIKDDNDHADNQNNRLVFYEVYASDDIDGDGVEEEVIYQISDDLKKIVSATYLDAKFPHGHRPFSSIHFIKQSHTYYSRGLGHVLAAINIEVNTVINMINDNQEMINNPFFFYTPTTIPQDKKTLQNIAPGTGIEVMDTNGIFFPQWSQTPLANLNIFDSMLMFADRLSISPFASGSSQMRNAPRTARGTLALISEGNVKTDILVGQIQEDGFSELLYQIQGLLGENMSDEEFFWATGRDNKQTREMVTPKIMKPKVKFILKGNTTNTNPEIMRNVSEIRYQTAITHPGYAQDYQASINLLRDFFDHHKEGAADVGPLIPRQPGQGGTHAPMSQEDELTTMRFGHPVDVLATDDHAQHAAVIQKFMENSKLTEQLPEFVTAMIAEHMRGHLQHLQAAQFQAQQDQGQGGLANNVPQSEIGLAGGQQ